MLRTLTVPPRQRRGIILSIELILVLPILLLVLLAFVQFSLIANARSRIDNIAITAANQLPAVHHSPRQIRQFIGQMLGNRLAQDSFAEIVMPNSSQQIGSIRLIIPMQNATPDLLWMIGFSVRNRFIVSEAPLIARQSGVAQSQRL